MSMLNRGDAVAAELAEVRRQLDRANRVVQRLRAGIEPTDAEVRQLAESWIAAGKGFANIAGEATDELAERRERNAS